MKTQTIASVGLFAKLALSQSVINSGNGFGTYYYDVVDRNGCGNNFALINTGSVECNQFTGLSLNQINSNNVVAMNRTLLASNFAKYCGKKVVVSFNGVPSSQQFFIGDGCERCATGPSTASVWNPNGAPGLDFSLSGLDGINSNGCFAGHLDISWQILDETLYNFDTNAPGQPTGPVSGGGSNPGNGGGSNPGNGSGSCSWAGHCQGATCSTDDDCSDPWGCVNGICGGSSSGGSAPPPSNTCSWVGHCIGASCGSDDDCSDNFVCNSGKCANP